jgi:hypothetical protein
MRPTRGLDRPKGSTVSAYSAIPTGETRPLRCDRVHPQGSPHSGRAPVSQCDVVKTWQVATAPCPGRPLNQEQDEQATRGGRRGGDAVAQPSAEEPDVTARQLATNSSIARGHLVAFVEGSKLRLRGRII